MNQRDLFQVDSLPVFQNKMFTTQAQAIDCIKADMQLVQDTTSGLIFNAAFDASLLEYDENYQNEQACSSVFKQHLDKVKDIIKPHFLSEPALEIGCGKGYFLERLNQLGYDVTGIDPAYEGDNPKIIQARFDQALGLSANGIIMRHVLEHIANPINFLLSIAEANGGKGKIYIEVPCLDWIVEHAAWFDIFYEHVNYFRLADFYRIFGTVFESGHVFGGQYLYVVADLATLRKPIMKHTDLFVFPEKFLSNVELLANIAKQKNNAIWGGASKGVIFALYMQRENVQFDSIVDINPAKQGQYIAATGLQVDSPEIGIRKLAKHDNIFVMNSNYLTEIIELSGNQFNYITVD